jgi:hypothetical protein
VADGLTAENRHRRFKSPAARGGDMNRQQIVALVFVGLMVMSSIGAVASIF